MISAAPAVKFFDVTFIGVDLRTGKKLVLSAGLLFVVIGIRWLALRLVRKRVASRPDSTGFWSRQGIQLVAAVLLVLGLVSIWVNPGTNLTTGLGLISAGLAFALQQVITSIAGYFVILRGDTFNVGDRIVLGKVRGDVIRLGFIKTTVMEMGQPSSVQDADPAVWIHGRQYTGRVVTVSNGQIFSEPVFNYTRDFPYVWDEIVLPISYGADHERVEQILLDSARTIVPIGEMSQQSLHAMQQRYELQTAELEPTVYLRITDNWLETTLRFVLPARQARGIKDQMTRLILRGLDEAAIGIASATYEIVGLPPLRVGPHNPDEGPMR